MKKERSPSEGLSPSEGRCRTRGNARSVRRSGPDKAGSTGHATRAVSPERPHVAAPLRMRASQPAFREERGGAGHASEREA